ncbi:MAG TPA: hypothetical protein VKA37_12215 [Halobacteriales archaeon]|nr:hypothetical protein [Halobacteriales archaeon]
MTTFGVGLVYSLFHLAAFAALALPLTGFTLLGERWLGDVRQGLLVAAVGLLWLVGVVAVVVGVAADADTMWTVFVLGACYVVWPLAVAVGVARAATEVEWNRLLRLSLFGWDLALALSLVVAALGATPAVLIADTPSLLGLDWLSGYVVYLAVVGVVGGTFATALDARL